MAEYWIESENGELSERVDDYLKLQEIVSKSPYTSNNLTYCAEGNDIDFENLLLDPVMLKCKIHSCENLQLDIYSSEFKKGFSSIFLIECDVRKLTLSGLKLDYIHLMNCEIGEAVLVNTYTFELYILDTSLNDLQIESGFNSGKVTIRNSIFENCHFNLLDLDVLRIEGFNCKGDFQIDNSSIQRLFLDKVLFKHLSIKNSHLLSQANIFNISQGSILDFNNFNLIRSSVLVKTSSGKCFFNDCRTEGNFSFKIQESPFFSLFFNRCHFNNETQFEGDIFTLKETMAFKDSVFKDLVLFSHNAAKCLRFEKTLINKGIFLTLDLPKQISFKWWKLRKRIIKIKTDKTYRESISSSVWCLLKNQSLSRNDKINALEYRRYEMEAYKHELLKVKGRSQEKLVLALNYLSNNYGISWGRGLLFTGIFWIIMYSLYVVSVDCFEGFFTKNSVCIFSDSNFWIGALDFLWLPQGIKDLVDNLKFLPWYFSIGAIVWFLLGKIFVGFGIYQTIAAFRKHGNL